MFKAPHHNFHLEAILAAYPDARFVMTHRDPVKAVPSWASLVSTIFPETDSELDLHRLGREVSNHLRVGVEQAIAARARIGEDRFHDVHHREFVADPMGVGAARLRLPRLRAHADGGADHRATGRRNRSGAQGTHRYTAEQFGLTDAQLRDDYRFYTDHFDVDTEGTHDRDRMALPTWADQMRALERVGDNLIAAWRPDGATEAEVQDMNKLALSILAEGYLCRSTPTCAGRCSCRCGTTRSTRVVPTPTTCTRRSRSTRRASTRSRASAARRASSRSSRRPTTS